MNIDITENEINLLEGGLRYLIHKCKQDLHESKLDKQYIQDETQQKSLDYSIIYYETRLQDLETLFNKIVK